MTRGDFGNRLRNARDRANEHAEKQVGWSDYQRASELREAKHYEEARHYYEVALDACESRFGLNSVEGTRVRAGLALTLVHLGEYDRAIVMNQQNVEILSTHKGSGSEEAMRAQLSLGFAKFCLAQTSHSEPIMEEALSDVRQATEWFRSCYDPKNRDRISAETQLKIIVDTREQWAGREESN